VSLGVFAPLWLQILKLLFDRNARLKPHFQGIVNNYDFLCVSWWLCAFVVVDFESVVQER